MSAAPNEADPPLPVNPKGMLSLAVTAQGFQLVSRRRRQDAQFRGGMQLRKLPERHTLKRTEAPGMLKVEELLRFPGRKALNHT
jgi:hypothetical protein